MQVDLFKDTNYVGSSARLGKQIETRKFNLCRALEDMRAVLPEFDNARVSMFLNHLERVAAHGRHYNHIGLCGNDSVWELECMGVCSYAKKYSVVLDCSLMLDYLMHVEFSCPLEKAHMIENYESVSRSMLNYHFHNNTLSLGSLFVNTPEVYGELNRLLGEIIENANGATEEEQMIQFVYRLYVRLLNQLENIKNYVVYALQQQFPKQLIYRSKSFSKAIMSSDIPINEDIVLKSPIYDDYVLHLRSYERYAWAREVITDETKWEVENW